MTNTEVQNSSTPDDKQAALAATEKKLTSLQDELNTTSDTTRQKELEAEIKKTQEALNTLKQELGEVSPPSGTPEASQEYAAAPDQSQRDAAISALEENNITPSDDPSTINLNNITQEGGVLAIILQLLQVMFGGVFESQPDGSVTQTQDDAQAIAQRREKLQDPNRIRGDLDFYTLLASPGGKSFQPYEEMILRWTGRMNIDPGILLQLFIKEGSRGNLRAGPGGKNTAVGFGQITNDTWNLICNSIAPNQYNVFIDKQKGRYDAESQIKAACIYLDYCAKQRQVDHATAIVYYHMGPNPISIETAQSYLANNPAIAKHHRGPVTQASYVEAARDYYLA